MNKQIPPVQLSQQDKAVVREIKKLRKSAPSYWVDVVAAKMGKSTNSVRSYAVGMRGITEGSHIEVLRLLKEVIEKKNRGIEDLLS